MCCIFGPLGPYSQLGLRDNLDVDYKISLEQFYTRFGAVSEQFQSSFRADSEQIQSRFGAVSEQFQTISEQF